MIKIEYIFCPAVGLYVSLYRASMDSGHTSNHGVEHTHTHTYSPSSSSPVLLSQASSPTASDGKTRGNQPYSSKSTMNSPMAPRVTCTPSSLSAAAWFCAPSGWDLQPTAIFISMHQIAGNRHSPLTRRKLPQAALQGGKANVPRRYDALGIDDPLPRDVGVVEAVRRIARQVLHAHAHLSGPLCCHPPSIPRVSPDSRRICQGAGRGGGEVTYAFLRAWQCARTKSLCRGESLARRCRRRERRRRLRRSAPCCRCSWCGGRRGAQRTQDRVGLSAWRPWLTRGRDRLVAVRRGVEVNAKVTVGLRRIMTPAPPLVGCRWANKPIFRAPTPYLVWRTNLQSCSAAGLLPPLCFANFAICE